MKYRCPAASCCSALLAIAGGTVLAQTERLKLSNQHYFKTREEMQKLFADLPEALESAGIAAHLTANRQFIRQASPRSELTDRES